MDVADRWRIKHTISRIETILRTNPWHCDYDYLMALKAELEGKLNE